MDREYVFVFVQYMLIKELHYPPKKCVDLQPLLNTTGGIFVVITTKNGARYTSLAGQMK
jgi:hypothetical protein